MKFSNGIEITNLANVRRLPDGGFLLNVDLYTPTDGLETVDYVARDGDVAETGKWVYEQIVAGNFEGEITDWVPPPPPTAEEIAERVRSQRDYLLAKTDWTQAADVPQATKDRWAPYRQALRDVPQQAEFPTNVTWPIEPV